MFLATLTSYWKSPTKLYSHFPSKSIGLYLPDNAIRGFGVWKEGDRIIRNLGQEIIESDHYVYSCPPDKVRMVEGLVKIKTFLEFLRKADWEAASAPELVLGWSFSSVICGCLDWRPHLGISGAAGSGKSTVIKGIAAMLTPACITPEGISTEAGIRQRIGMDARPCLMDELEAEGCGDHNRLARIIKLIRSSSSATPARKRSVVSEVCVP